MKDHVRTWGGTVALGILEGGGAGVLTAPGLPGTLTKLWLSPDCPLTVIVASCLSYSLIVCGCVCVWVHEKHPKTPEFE